MKPILKDFYSTDIDSPLSDYIPICPDNFGFIATFIVGEEQLGGEESFNITICTPNWLMLNHSSDDIIIGRHYLIVFKYDFRRIYETIRNYIEKIEADKWDEIGIRIGCLGYWEFEDYKE